MINRAIVKDYTVCSQNNVTTHLICELNLDIDPTPCIIDDVKLMRDFSCTNELVIKKKKPLRRK